MDNGWGDEANDSIQSMHDSNNRSALIELAKFIKSKLDDEMLNDDYKKALLDMRDNLYNNNGLYTVSGKSLMEYE